MQHKEIFNNSKFAVESTLCPDLSATCFIVEGEITAAELLKVALPVMDEYEKGVNDEQIINRIIDLSRCNLQDAYDDSLKFTVENLNFYRKDPASKVAVITQPGEIYENFRSYNLLRDHQDGERMIFKDLKTAQNWLLGRNPVI